MKVFPGGGLRRKEEKCDDHSHGTPVDDPVLPQQLQRSAEPVMMRSIDSGDVFGHFDRIAAEAGLEIMSDVFGILWNREVIKEQLALTADDVVDLYELFIGPAIDEIESVRFSEVAL